MPRRARGRRRRWSARTGRAHSISTGIAFRAPSGWSPAEPVGYKAFDGNPQRETVGVRRARSLYGQPVQGSCSNSLAEQNRVYVVACPEAIIAAFEFAPLQYTTARIRPYGSAPTWKSSSSTRARAPSQKETRYAFDSGPPVWLNSGASTSTSRTWSSSPSPSVSRSMTSVSPSMTRVTVASRQIANPLPIDSLHGPDSEGGGGLRGAVGRSAAKPARIIAIARRITTSGIRRKLRRPFTSPVSRAVLLIFPGPSNQESEGRVSGPKESRPFSQFKGACCRIRDAGLLSQPEGAFRAPSRSP